MLFAHAHRNEFAVRKGKISINLKEINKLERRKQSSEHIAIAFFEFMNGIFRYACVLCGCWSLVCAHSRALRGHCALHTDESDGDEDDDDDSRHTGVMRNILYSVSFVCLCDVCV